jgi:hypothetical protein
LSRKSREDIAIAENVTHIAKLRDEIARLQDEIRTLLAVNDALVALKNIRKKPGLLAMKESV